MTSIALYDMDKTITRRATLLAWLVFYARAEAPWRLALLPLLGVAALGYALRLLDRTRLKQLAQALLMGPGCARATVARRAAAFAAVTVASGLWPGAVVQLAADRAEGRTLVLATASYAYYVDAIAAALGFDAVLATESIWDGDTLRPRVAGANCYGAAKAARVAAWLESRPHAPMRFYSDHVSDAPLFERADEAVAVCPSPALRRLATARGWRIADWR